MSPASVPASTGCVKVLNDYQSVMQQQDAIDPPCCAASPKPQKLCTKVENGRVVVRPIDQSDSTS